MINWNAILAYCFYRPLKTKLLTLLAISLAWKCVSVLCIVRISLTSDKLLFTSALNQMLEKCSSLRAVHLLVCLLKPNSSSCWSDNDKVIHHPVVITTLSIVVVLSKAKRRRKTEIKRTQQNQIKMHFSIPDTQEFVCDRTGSNFTVSLSCLLSSHQTEVEVRGDTIISVVRNYIYFSLHEQIDCHSQ